MSLHLTTEFGYYPQGLDFTAGHITVSTRPDLAESVRRVSTSPRVDGDWIYSPRLEEHSTAGAVRQLPYSKRVFELPTTHQIQHANGDGPAHMEFLIWALSFFLGMRLTATEAGFLDATPIKSGKLVDFILHPRRYPAALELAEQFWQSNKAAPTRAKEWSGAVHALFLGQYPQALQYERFIHLYGALDACFALARQLRPPGRKLTHAKRISWMCGQFNIPAPLWATGVSGGPIEVADIRNATLHETLFMGAPLGFALHGVGTGQSLTLEMGALVGRLLIALIGAPHVDYVRTPATTYQTCGLDL